VAGVIGRTRFAFDLWSETVNLACRLETTGEAGRIQIAESTCDRLKGKYQFEKRHRADAEGPDDLPTYWLGNRTGHPAAIGTTGKAAA
jgi:class 3 adenylate cyclase